jgi:hypothetical protein
VEVCWAEAECQVVCANLLPLTVTLQEKPFSNFLNRNEHQFEKVFKGSYKEETAKPTKSANGNGVHA